MFTGLLVTKTDTGLQAVVQTLDDAVLGEGDVLVDVQWSTMNYKDGLAITGTSAILRKSPMVPGIDFAGVVRESSNAAWKPGDLVLLNGWGVGETQSGGLAQRARVRGECLTRLPQGMTARQSMAIGTAGYTAMLCVLALERHGVTPGDGEILVTGASGGVGSVAVALLARLGFSVVASTGRPAEADYLKALGAAEVIDRHVLSTPGKPLVKERWAGVVDSVGSHTLVNACASTKYRGAVTACGLAGGMDFPASVAPFILRGITLYGIDSVMAPRELRERAWTRLAQDLDFAKLERMTTKITLADVPETARQLMAGQVRGRRVVKL